MEKNEYLIEILGTQQLGEDDKDTVDEVTDIKDPNELIGKLTVILGASNDNEDPTEGVSLRNGGRICPPHCGKG